MIKVWYLIDFENNRAYVEFEMMNIINNGYFCNHVIEHGVYRMCDINNIKRNSKIYLANGVRNLDKIAKWYD